MASRLDQLLAFDSTALNLRTQRQQILATNIANADVPQYKARDIDFPSALRNALAGSGSGTALAATGPGHLPGNAQAAGSPQLLYRVPTQDSLDGNTVQMDTERAQFADNTVHIEADLTFLNSQIKMMLAALQSG